MISFLDFAAGTSSLLAASAGAFSSVYGTIEGVSLAKEREELQGKILKNRSNLEDEILNVQKNIFLDQQETAKKSNEIDLKIKEARADLEIQKIESEFNKLNSNDITSNSDSSDSSKKYAYYFVGGFLVVLSAAIFLRKRV